MSDLPSKLLEAALGPPQPTLLTHDWDCPGFSKDSEPQKRRHAMRYYITVLADYLTISKQRNSFTSAFVPMAIESPALANALIAYSADHLSDINESYSSTSVRARSQSLTTLASNITGQCSDIASREADVAASLVLLTSEVCHGNYAAWYHHLVGAKNMILSTNPVDHSGDAVQKGTDAFKSSPEGRWVLRNFAYHDILGTVTMETAPLIDASYLQDMKDGIDTYLGVAVEILIYISRISTLATETSQNSSNFLEDCLRLEQQLLTWHPSTPSPPELVQVALGYRSAALIYLYRLIRLRCSEGPYSTLIEGFEAKISRSVTETLTHTSAVPVGDVPESALLFPLFIAGGECNDNQEMEAIRNRLHGMSTKRRFHNIIRALDILESLWETRNRLVGQGLGVCIDWKDFVSVQGEGGLLLT
ncbi:hypothetical protein CMUS01_11791 [Colletotrichum musicola]|uniref:Uncharacterized protein n=1 Tax=Colletotrichum musicola TaxID=2175873 RepID=A0A8H6JTX3_9PEZI|nr:hypothetical protein CMUS01_11791 [Colletotrichum musicola]